MMRSSAAAPADENPCKRRLSVGRPLRSLYLAAAFGTSDGALQGKTNEKWDQTRYIGVNDVSHGGLTFSGVKHQTQSLVRRLTLSPSKRARLQALGNRQLHFYHLKSVGCGQPRIGSTSRKPMRRWTGHNSSHRLISWHRLGRFAAKMTYVGVS
jgi:hypothetical protein